MPEIRHDNPHCPFGGREALADAQQENPELPFIFVSGTIGAERAVASLKSGDGEELTPTLVSDNIERLLGFNVAESSSYEWWLENLHPEDRERVLGIVRRGMRGQGYSTEYRVRHKDGTYRWIQDDGHVVEHPKGQLREAIGLWTDITEPVITLL